ncbi:MAG TPA: crotonase/enoyl-CoA hydratase family protein [Polyangiaceae bacterium]|jgi:enoyl-CoA hydratase|nr:crotonase/enoyl-CoA hydratase family protein [Polyangiaceae bacterium]
MAVLSEQEGPVTVILLGRPERRNAVDRATAAALLAAYRRFDEDDESRVLVIAGGEEAFCSGADLKALDNDVDAPGGPMGFTRLRAKKPVIAAIEGWCVAGGLEIALFCDLRVAGNKARFGCLERRFGVPLIDGGTQRLPRVVGLGRALDLILTGRVIDADEAEEIGLVNRVVPAGHARRAAIELATEIAGFPWPTLLADRDSLYDGIGRPLEDGLELEAARGKAVLHVGAEGAQRFARGTGRHGKSV